MCGNIYVYLCSLVGGGRLQRVSARARHRSELSLYIYICVCVCVNMYR